MNTKHFSITLTVLVFLGAAIFIGYQGSYGGTGNIIFASLFALPFYSFPLIVNLVLTFKWKNCWSHAILAVSSVLYGLWFAHAMYDAFYVHLDPQSALIILFVGIYSLPVLVPLWIVAGVVEMFSRKRQIENIEEETGPEPSLKAP